MTDTTDGTTGAPPSLESLLATYGQDDDPFTFKLPRGEEITAKRFRDASLAPRLRRKARDLETVMKSGACPEPLKPFADVEYDILYRCVLGERMLVQPKLSLADLLRLSQSSGALILHLTDPLLASAENVYAIDNAARIEEEGNESGPTLSTD